MAQGNWIVLENCHLDLDLALRLCVEYQSAIDAENVHEEFRLWCVTAPTSAFPIVVLRQAVKFTCNPPNNLKERILKHAAHLIDEKQLRWSFALVTFHAVLQERQSFHAIGWNQPYSFKDHSLLQTMTYLKSLVKTANDFTDGIAYLVTECIYGGSVVDHVDRRLLRSLFEQICCISTTTFFENAGIRIPAVLTSENCVKAIDVLSPHETNAVDLGLHPNSDFERGFRKCDYILSILSPTVPDDAGDSSIDSAQIVCNDILKCLPLPLTVNSPNADDLFGPIRRYEAVHFNELLQCMRSTLTELNQAINGDIHMVDDLQQICRSLHLNCIPSAWSPFVYRTSKSLASFIQDLIARVTFFHRWVSVKPPSCFWFAAFYNPAALVASMRTAYAIANGIDLNDVCVLCTVSVGSAQNDSILIEVSAYISVTRFFSLVFFIPKQGLHIKGARWNLDSDCIDEPLPRQFFTPMPIIELRPVVKRPNDVSYTEMDGTQYRYNVPVFHTVSQSNERQSGPSTTNFVMFLDLKSHQLPIHWINRSTAIYCQLPE